MNDCIVGYNSSLWVKGEIYEKSTRVIVRVSNVLSGRD
jgi:hypothetical protein